MEGAWWDYVDSLAIHLVGQVLLNQRDATTPKVRAWIDDPDMWLRRSAIIGQIGTQAGDRYRSALRRLCAADARNRVLHPKSDRLGAPRLRQDRPIRGCCVRDRTPGRTFRACRSEKRRNTSTSDTFAPWTEKSCRTCGTTATARAKRCLDTRRISSSSRLSEDFDRGTALDLGCGQGRNALWLAERGFTVTGLDLSPVAIEQARARAAELGLDATFESVDLLTWNPDGQEWDLVVSGLHPLARRHAADSTCRCATSGRPGRKDRRDRPSPRQPHRRASAARNAPTGSSPRSSLPTTSPPSISCATSGWFGPPITAMRSTLCVSR